MEPADPVPPFDQSLWRRRIPILSSHVLMNACSHAPQSDATREAAESYLHSWNTRGMDWDGWMADVQGARRAFAQLVNADEDSIAIFGSVSDATSAVATAIDFARGRDRALVTEAEFPTVGHAWLAQERRGARVDWVPVTSGTVEAGDIAARLGDNTAVLSVSHGYYLNGAMQDLTDVAQLAHDRGALVYVDTYQTAGAVPIDVKATNVDFLAAGCLKYLMGIPGIAFLYVKPSLLATLEPLMTGWFGRVNPFAFDTRTLDWAPTARRFDMGTPPILNACIARAGIEMVNSIGVPQIRAWHEVLSARLLAGAQSRGLTVHGTTDVRHKTASTACVVADAGAVEAAMRKQHVLASARGPVVRLAPHFFTTLADVDRALDVLASIVTHRSNPPYAPSR
jgi:selenocysteine lyase/cysteine desulfurase